MADIKQAAKWIQEGRDVQRRQYAGRFWLTPYYPLRLSYEVVCADGGEHVLDCLDLLADDWELVT
jgi:hypothetical protein